MSEDKEKGRLEDPSWLHRKYWGEEMTMSEIADELGTYRQKVGRKMKEFGIEVRDVGGVNKNAIYRDEDWLRKQYHEVGNNTYEIADIAGVAASTIRHHMDKFGIDRKDRGHNSKEKPPAYYTSKSGYETVANQFGGNRKQATIHQLILIAEGEDPSDVFSKDTNAHHKNDVPWDNRPENIELLTIEEHARHHAKEIKFWEYRHN